MSITKDTKLAQLKKTTLIKELGKGNNALEASIERGLRQSDKREVHPHEEVWAEIRDRYKKQGLSN